MSLYQLIFGKLFSKKQTSIGLQINYMFFETIYFVLSAVLYPMS